MKTRCNICGGTKPEKYGKNREIECVGHHNIKAMLWNFHPDHKLVKGSSTEV